MKKYSVMKWYPIIQIICSIPATINRLYDVITKSNSFWLMLIQALFDGIEGLLITIIFLLDPEIKHSLKICFFRILKRKSEISMEREYGNSFHDSEITPNELESKNESEKVKENLLEHA